MSNPANMDHSMARRSHADSREFVCPNTNKAYGAQQRFFVRLCDIIPGFAEDGSDERNKYLVTEKKAFMFLWNTVYRKKRSPQEPLNTYSVAEYQETVDKHPFDRPTALDAPAWEYNSESTFEQAYGAMLALARDQEVEQQRPGLERAVKESIRIKQLRTVVTTRKGLLRRLRHEEKIDEYSDALRLLPHLAAIEEEFWKQSATGTLRQAMLSLRNRSFYLFTKQGILRGESLWYAELSDMFDFHYKAQEEPQAYHGLLLQIRISKTTRKEDRTLYGRVFRHKDPKMCTMGAVCMYLMIRFMVTKEDKSFDFTSNEAWFDVKLMVRADARPGKNTEAVNTKQYFEAISKIYQNLGLSSRFKCHLGRHVGPVYLEMEELEPPFTKLLGNWGRGVQDQSYSAQLPLPALRLASGGSRNRGTHYLVRGSVVPSEDLRRQIWHDLVEPQREKLAALPNGRTKVTALAFLEFLDNARTVILQDAAWMMLQDRRHVLFEAHPVFRSAQFADFQEQMRRAKENAETSDPVHVDIERVLPTVGVKLSNLHNGVQQAKTEVLNRLDDVGARVQLQERRMELHHQRLEHRMHHIQQTQQMQHSFMQALGQVASDYSRASGAVDAMGRQPAWPAFTMPPTFAMPAMPQPPGGVPAWAPGAAMPPIPPRPWASAPPRERTAAAAARLAPVPSDLHPRETYKTATEAYNDWYGLNLAVSHFPPGGIDALNREHGTAWRRLWPDKVKKRYTRLRYVVRRIDAKKGCYRDEGQTEGEATRSALNFYDAWIGADPRKRGTLASMERALKEQERENAQEEPMQGG